MSKDYRVNTFGLTDEENTLVDESLPTRAYELYIADTPTDVIAIGCDAMIVNAAALDPDSAEFLTCIHRLTAAPTKRSSGLTSRSRRRSCESSSNATIPLTPSRTSSSICCSLHTARAKKPTSTAKSWSTG